MVKADTNKEYTFHVKELKKLDYNLYHQLADSGESLTYSYDYERRNIQVEVVATIASNGSLVVEIGFDTNWGLRFGEEGVHLEKFVAKAVSRTADLSTNDNVNFHVRELEKLSYEFYRQLSEGKEPLTYCFATKACTGQVEICAERSTNPVRVFMYFDIDKNQEKIKSSSFCYAVDVANNWIRESI